MHKEFYGFPDEPEEIVPPENPYLLMTPGPLSTSKAVKAAMLRDWCTWDSDYTDLVQEIRDRLVRLADAGDSGTAVLMQGSGTFSVESVISSVIPENGKLLVLANGAYGNRIAHMASRHRISCTTNDSGELRPPDLDRLEQSLKTDPAITHVAVVHCETTTGMVNPIAEIGRIVAACGKIFIVDAMSSFGGIPLSMNDIPADFLISSANKCIQGVPGFGFIIARRKALEASRGIARSLSLDLYDQWKVMEDQKGKWRFTSPTHVVRAFHAALDELDREGGICARNRRYCENHRVLVEGMRRSGFRTLLPDEWQSPVITAFHSPDSPRYDFSRFYQTLKSQGFVIYPGKATSLDTFRIGTIGRMNATDIRRFLDVVESGFFWK